MPDRILGKHPRFASYLILAMALVIFGLTVYVYLLSGRVSDGEALRRSEAKAQIARRASECRSSVKGTAQARKIVEGLRATYLELAANAINPDSVEILRRRAKDLPMFPAPRCGLGGGK